MPRFAQTVAVVALCFLAGAHLARAEPIYTTGGDRSLDAFVAESDWEGPLFQGDFSDEPEFIRTQSSLTNAIASSSFVNAGLLERPHTPTGLPGWRYGLFKNRDGSSGQPTPAPEPATLLLLGGGLAGVLARKRRSASRDR